MDRPRTHRELLLRHSCTWEKTQQFGAVTQQFGAVSEQKQNNHFLGQGCDEGDISSPWSVMEWLDWFFFYLVHQTTHVIYTKFQTT